MNKEIKDVGFSWNAWIKPSCTHKPQSYRCIGYNFGEDTATIKDITVDTCKCTDEEKRKDGIM